MKVAVIGRGFGAYAMKPAFEARGWEVELVPSRDAAAVASACAGPFDLISIHSPPFQHRDHVLQAVAAGKDVLCDKPFGLNAAEAHEMRDAASTAGVLHFVNFEFRFGAARQKARELLQAGAIGTLQHLAYSSYAGFLRVRDHGWLNDASLGGGWLGALGSHIIDITRWHFGSEVTGSGGTGRLDVPLRPDGSGGQVQGTAEDAFTVWLTMANGGTASIDAASAAATVRPQCMYFQGSEGAMELIDEKVLTLLRPGAGPELFDCSPGKDSPAWPSLQAWIGELEVAIAHRRQIAPSFDEGVATAEVLERLKAAMVRADRSS